jgi:hypothetical protein
VADRRRDRASIPAAISRTAPVMMFWYEGGSAAEQIVNAVTLMWVTSIPARRAASTLPPVANRCRPHVVRFKAIVVTTIRSG